MIVSVSNVLIDLCAGTNCLESDVPWKVWGWAGDERVWRYGVVLFASKQPRGNQLQHSLDLVLFLEYDSG